MGPGTATAILLAGWLIGATGIGGVLVVPVLTLQGLAPQEAIAASALAFAFPGAAALYWLRRAPGGWSGPVPTLVLSAMPGALLGAILVHRLQPGWLLAGLALLAVASGARGLRGGSAPAAAPGELPRPAAAGLGAAVGLGSALTGTGGPVLMIPLLMLLRQPLDRSIAAAQAIQLPLALCVTLPHWQAGRLDLAMALGLGVLLLAGSLAGQWAARRIATGTLQRGVCLLLLATGFWLAWRAIQLTVSSA